MKFTRTVLERAGKVRVETACMPERIAEGDVRLRLASSGICGTDMHYFRHFANAGMRLDRPTTLGHEACAHVLDANGSQLSEGQLVAINPVIACGNCPNCRTGDINMCTGKRFPGSATTRPHIDGFFRDVFDFPARCCTAVEAGIDPDHLAMSEPLACAMHAVTRADVRQDDSVLVVGCGPMGLLATAAAVARGAVVHAVDIREEAAETARAAGAATVSAVTAVAGDRFTERFDIVVEASGSPKAFNLALDAVCKQGRLAVLSLIQPAPVPIDLHRVALKEVTVIGSILFAREFEAAVEFIRCGTRDMDHLISDRLPLDRAQAAFDAIASGRATGKVILKPSGWSPDTW
ncbi:MAG: alcohol dehydrogenase catalytic domain-containing protein [Paracoccaceae bacterium]|nr:alcohol dehydrogenase catalytic domain-containing protein [Paracoccaceae bacterium]